MLNELLQNVSWFNPDEIASISKSIELILEIDKEIIDDIIYSELENTL
ncbi:hypothetical protein M0R19_05140 [Candidatus Pacearchaeota archaeon]|jgi:hypothetical protein|nr:hypothetical protein [Candidatus Pacearchaeota archaeon]